jgi:hypothetical protein
MNLTWALCHHDGREKGWLTEREIGAEVLVAVNGQSTATVTAHLEEDVAKLIHPGRSRLKVYCHPEHTDDPTPGGFLLHNGLILQPKSSGRRVEIASVDQSVRLLNASHGQYPLSDEVAAEGGGIWAAFEGKTADAMWELIWRADKRKRQINAEVPSEKEIAGLGILQGTLEDHGPTREWKFGDGQVTWDAIVEMASRTRAPDFELEPLDREDGNHARFHTHYPRMGANRRDEVVLEYGVNTSPDFGYEPATVDLCNRYALVGKEKRGQARVYVAENRMSMRLYGVWQRDETTNTRDWAKLEDRAHEYVAKRAFQVHFVDVTPAVEIGGTARGFSRNAQGELVERNDEFAIPPRFGPRVGLGFDYWLGDTITVRAKEQFNLEVAKAEPGPETDFYCRVMEARFTEVDKDANIAVPLTLVPVVDTAHVSGYRTMTRPQQT